MNMLRIIQSTNSNQAKTYFRTPDYYIQNQELDGIWRGQGAARLGLSGTVQERDWNAMCDNRDPNSGETLTVRQRPGRRIGYDFNFHAPKSVSVMHALTGDGRILLAFQEAVHETMEQIEAEAQTRVRTNGRNESQVTGNLAWGEFVHLTSRPVDGTPDPHTHAHCFVLNQTWDDVEKRWKAVDLADVNRDAPFFEAVFHSRLSDKLAKIGYPITRTKKRWEINGVPAAVRSKFSRRTAQIEETAIRNGIVDAADKDQLGARTRERKQSRLTMDELNIIWRNRLSPDELNAIDNLTLRTTAESDDDAKRHASNAVELALQHCLERSAVVAERTAQTEALKRAYGSAPSDAVMEAFAAQSLLRADRQSRHFITTHEVLAEEERMLAFARDGRGTEPGLGSPGHPLNRVWLSDDQRMAVEHVLRSTDRVTLIRGAAGTGKTTMMQEAVEGIEASGKQVLTFAPSASASRGVLREEGFESADTLARLLVDAELQERARGQVIWIDEAGLVGSRTMGQVFELAERLHARIVLSGDTRQHGSVERGASLRLLETEAGLVPAEIREIQRQKADYKRVVRKISEGQIGDGFRQLDRLGWIREADWGSRYKLLAADYLGAAEEGKSALVVSPTHLESEWITSEIRRGLIQSKVLKGTERTVEVLEAAHLTEAERRDPASYLPGDVLIYHQNAPGVHRGSKRTFGSDPVNLEQAPRFQVFHRRSMQIRPGEMIRITRNGKTKDGRHRLNNGAIFTVKRITNHGDLELANTITASGKRRRLDGWTVPSDYGHIDYGYVSTSYSSQGRTVDRVFIAESAASYAAASREQFYVSLSRGREQAVVYTDDKRSLLNAVTGAEDRPTATELVTMRDRQIRAAIIIPPTPRVAAEATLAPSHEMSHER